MHALDAVSSMSEVAEGPEISVIGGRRRVTAGATRGDRLGHELDDLLGRDDAEWWSGTSVIARRPLTPPPSRTSVPVSAIATAQPVTTPSSRRARRRSVRRPRSARRPAGRHARRQRRGHHTRRRPSSRAGRGRGGVGQCRRRRGGPRRRSRATPLAHSRSTSAPAAELAAAAVVAGDRDVAGRSPAGTSPSAARIAARISSRVAGPASSTTPLRGATSRGSSGPGRQGQVARRGPARERPGQALDPPPRTSGRCAEPARALRRPHSAGGRRTPGPRRASPAARASALRRRVCARPRGGAGGRAPRGC